jgi:hypothetical protein
VSLLLHLCDQIASAPEGVVAACRRLSLEHPGRGYSWGSLKNNYYAWLQAGRDWRVLVRRGLRAARTRRAPAPGGACVSGPSGRRAVATAARGGNDAAGRHRGGLWLHRR